MANLGSLSILKTESGRGRNALALLLESSPFLRFLESVSGWQEDASSFNYRAGEETANAAARAVNDSYSARERTRPPLLSGELRNHGDSVTTDITLLADAARGLADADKWLESAIATSISSFGRIYEGLLFNSDGEDDSFVGLKTILDGTTDIPGFTSWTGVADAADATSAADNSLDISGATNQALFIEYLRTQIAEVDDARAIVMSPKLLARINTIALNMHAITPGGEDMFGKPIRTFDSIPIITTLPDTLPANEPDNAGTPVNNTTSLYIMSPGEDRFSLSSNSGLYYIDRDHVDNAEKGKEVYEIRAAWKILVKRAVRRIRNIKL